MDDLLNLIDSCSNVDENENEEDEIPDNFNIKKN